MKTIDRIIAQLRAALTLKDWQDISRIYLPSERARDVRLDCQTVPGGARRYLAIKNI